VLLIEPPSALVPQLPASFPNEGVAVGLSLDQLEELVSWPSHSALATAPDSAIRS
jgi:hypothetical protein